MNEKKTVLLLINGFGVESSKSFEVYSKELMPTFDKLITAFPFKLCYSGGEFIGLNEKEVSNFKTGYYAFSTFGHPSKKEGVLQNKINANEFVNNPVINASIDQVVNNEGSSLNVIFSLGDKVTQERYEQLKTYLSYAEKKGVKEIFIHLILGDSSTRGLKIAPACITEFKNRVMRYFPKAKIASIASRSHLKETNIEETYNYYRMLVSSVGEIWIDYMTTIERKYVRNMNDDTMNAFLTIQGFYLKDNDSVFIFNYSNNIGKTFFDIFLHPKKYFPTSNVPEKIKLNSLFPVTNMTNVIPTAFEDQLPEAYFLDKIPDEKKVLIIAEKDRVPYISKSLNGFRPSFTQNISVWPIVDKSKRFEQTSQYLAAYINQSAYDLIIVDCELYDPSCDVKTIEQIKNNLKELDKVINITYNRATEKDYRLIISSLYGIRDSFKLTTTMEQVDLSQKVPFLLIDREIRRVDVVFKNMGTFIDVARIIAISYGSRMTNGLIQLGTLEDKKSSGSKKLIIMAVPIIILLVLVVIYLKTMGYF